MTGFTGMTPDSDLRKIIMELRKRLCSPRFYARSSYIYKNKFWKFHKNPGKLNNRVYFTIFCLHILKMTSSFASEKIQTFVRGYKESAARSAVYKKTLKIFRKSLYQNDDYTHLKEFFFIDLVSTFFAIIIK